MSSKEYCGDDLISLFENLDIDLGNLHPNVIRGWFDTDDEDMRKLLTWMCKNLGKQNILEKQESVEYTNLLGEDEEENSCNARDIELEYPGIFDVERNEFYINLMKEEIEICTEELLDLNNKLALNRNVNKTLLVDSSELKEKLLKSKMELNEALLKCENLSINLDDINVKLHEEMARYGEYLYEFEYSIPRFINNLEINKFDQNIVNIRADMETVLNKLSNNIKSNIINMDLDNIHKRISHSLQNHSELKCKEQQLQAILSFLNSYNFNSYLFVQKSYLETEVAAKKKQNMNLTKRQKSVMVELADYYISQPKLSYALNELDTQNLNLKHVSKILELIKTVLAIYVIASMFFKTEHKDIQNTESFFINICKYISNEIQPSIFRMEGMEKNIEELNSYKSKSISEKILLCEEVSKLLINERNCDSLEKVGEFINLLKRDMKRLECKLFSINFDSIFQGQLNKDIEILSKFLTPGPTCRINIIPLVLNSMFSNLQEVLKNQEKSLKEASEIIRNVPRSETSEEKLKRVSWMYSIVESSKPVLYETTCEKTSIDNNFTYM